MRHRNIGWNMFRKTREELKFIRDSVAKILAREQRGHHGWQGEINSEKHSEQHENGIRKGCSSER
jgi:hypothetical protein